LLEIVSSQFDAAAIRERAYPLEMDRSLQAELTAKGMTFNKPDLLVGVRDIAAGPRRSLAFPSFPAVRGGGQRRQDEDAIDSLYPLRIARTGLASKPSDAFTV